MTLAIWFWIIFVLSLIFGFYYEYVPGHPYPWPRGIRHLILYLLIFILGLQVFGGPVK